MNNWPRIKPPSKIKGWPQWPEDVQPVLRKWNQQGKLSFISAPNHGVYNKISYFKCHCCGEYCRHQQYGDCIFVTTGKVEWALSMERRTLLHEIVKRGNPYCDDCMIALAREYLEEISLGKKSAA